MFGLLADCELGGRFHQRLRRADVINVLLSVVRWSALHQGHIPVSTFS